MTRKIDNGNIPSVEQLNKIIIWNI